MGDIFIYDPPPARRQAGLAESNYKNDHLAEVPWTKADFKIDPAIIAKNNRNYKILTQVVSFLIF